MIPENGSYNSHKHITAFKLPDVSEWCEGNIIDCPVRPRDFDLDDDYYDQKCFSFYVDGVRFWIPKLELAGRIFFVDKTIVDAAFSPGGLDFYFTFAELKDSFDIFICPYLGIEPDTISNANYRVFISWLLTEGEVRRSFESIWKSLNQDCFITSDGDLCWDFDFSPPSILSGAKACFQGSCSSDGKDFFVWEIVKIEVFFKSEKKFKFYCNDNRPRFYRRLVASESFPKMSSPVDSLFFYGGVDTCFIDNG